ncbi:hypothetical protein [Pedobacter sp. SL55]|nr:hypothetical protein [Pedobacter sp. SL55]WAC40393.1 hypothetical protein OVA16_17760 [Pedobacter sp. SL55]
MAPHIGSITTDYLNNYQFSVDWFRGSSTQAAYTVANDPTSYFYGTLSN